MNIFFIISVIIHTIQNKRISVLKDSIRPDMITNTGNDERYIFSNIIDDVELDISAIRINNYKMKSIRFLESPAYTENAKLQHIQDFASDNSAYKPFSCWEGIQNDFFEMILFGQFI